MGKKSQSSPDTVGAATVEGEFSRDTARDVTYADRPDQQNVFGSNTWGQEMVVDPATGQKVTKWTQNQSLNPATQAIFDTQLARDQSLSDLSSGKMGAIESEMGAPLDWGQFGDVQGFDPDANRQRAEDAAYGRATSRLDPRFAEQQQALEVQMANRGLRAGDSAYDSAMQNFDRSRNDAYEQARMGATGEGRQEVATNLSTNERANALREQQIQEYLGKRGQSLSEAEALQDAQNLGEMTETFGGGQ
tara:strand:- start:307 stop:1050 length:744 start_codon:yes stop_codon:yes gene_type:complete